MAGALRAAVSFWERYRFEPRGVEGGRRSVAVLGVWDVRVCDGSDVDGWAERRWS